MSVRLLAALPFLFAPVSAALAGPAADAVRHFYDNLGEETLQETRDRYTGPARAFLDANDRVWAEREEICLDFAFAIDAQDYDEDELARTLALDETVDGDEAVVVARFSLFGEPRNIEWTLAEEGGVWKVSDVAGLDGEGWRLSEFVCE